MSLKPSDINFSQDSISNTFGKTTLHRNTYIGETLDELIHGTVTVFSIPTISVFRHKGKWFTSDNRRLWVFRKAEELEILRLIPVLKTFDFDAAKFTTTNGGLSVRVRRNDPGGQTWHLLDDERSRNKYQNYTHTLTQTNMCEQNIARHKSGNRSPSYSKAMKENLSYSDLVNCSEKTCNERSKNQYQSYIQTSNQMDIGEQNYLNILLGSSSYSKSSKENRPYSGLENNTEKPRQSYSRTSTNFNHPSFEELKSCTNHDYKTEFDTYGSSSYSKSSKENRPYSGLVNYSEKPRQSYSGSPTYSSHTSLEKLASRPDCGYKREYDLYGSSNYSKSSKENCLYSGLVNYSEKPRQSYSGSPTYSSHTSLEKLASRPDCGYKREYDLYGSSNHSKSSKENCLYSENNSKRPRQSYSRSSTNFNHLSFEELEWSSNYGYEREYSRQKKSCTRKQPDLIDGVIAIGALVCLFMKLL